jgi:hypothetical protein
VSFRLVQTRNRERSRFLVFYLHGGRVRTRRGNFSPFRRAPGLPALAGTAVSPSLADFPAPPPPGRLSSGGCRACGGFKILCAFVNISFFTARGAAPGQPGPGGPAAPRGSSLRGP